MNLLDAAKAYRELMNYRYTFLLGHKGKAETMMLEFTKEAFHHLAGLHKKDLERVKNKKYALDYILVVSIFSCPNSLCTCSIGIPLSMAVVAMVRLNLCGCT